LPEVSSPSRGAATTFTAEGLEDGRSLVTMETSAPRLLRPVYKEELQRLEEYVAALP